MSTRRLFTVLLLLTALATPTVAWAGVINGFGRYLGWGWSDGYHAQSAKPSRGSPRAPAGAYVTPGLPQYAPQYNPQPTPARTGPPVAPSRNALPRAVPLPADARDLRGPSSP